MKFDEEKLRYIIEDVCGESCSELDKIFLTQFTGAVLFLVPEMAAFLIENGLSSSAQSIHKSFLIVSEILKQMADAEK